MKNVFVMGMIPFADYAGETMRCGQNRESSGEPAEIPKQMNNFMVCFALCTKWL